MNPPAEHEIQASRPLVSVTSLLILSGFLIGVAVGQGVADDLSPYVLSSGLAGVLAYLGFDCAATRRREQALLREQQQFMSRLNRHVVHSQGSATDSELSAAAAAVKRELAARTGA
jgi:hypothetical protein